MPTVMLVQPHELNVPKLNLAQRALLLTALNTVMCGAGSVFCAVTYDKQTDLPPRLANEHYMEMPGVSPKAQFGEITQVWRIKTGEVRLRVRSASRGNGVSPTGWTTMIPCGLTSFVVTGISPVSRPFVTVIEQPQEQAQPAAAPTQAPPA